MQYHRQKEVDEVKRLRAKGVPAHKIAATLQVGTHFVHNILTGNSLPCRACGLPFFPSTNKSTAKTGSLECWRSLLRAL